MSSGDDAHLFGFQPIEMSWANDATADPVADILAMRDYVLDQAGYTPNKIFMSAAAHDLWVRWSIFRDQLEQVIEHLPRRSLIRRYVLRRVLGDARLAIIWPAAYYKRRRLEWRWTEFKHRNDPDWQ